MENDINNSPNPDDCRATLAPMQDALYVLSGKWRFPILIAIMEGKRRFGDIQKAVGIAPKVLSRDLKELELNGLVTRNVIDATHAVINYEPTEYSVSLAPVVKALSKWGIEHRQKIISQMKRDE